MRKENGITLIALVITIIVILILVGVTVTVALNGGLFEKTRNAANDTSKEATHEQIIAVAVGSMESNGKVNIDTLKSQLSNIQGIEYDSTATTLPLAVTYTKDGTTWNILDNGIVEEKTALPADWWIPTETEEAQIPTENVQSFIAYDGTNAVVLMRSGNIGWVYIQSSTNYLYVPDDETILAYFANINSEYTSSGWYTVENPSTGAGATPYTGNAPAVLSGFAPNQIYCKTYFDKIVESFEQ